MSPDAPLSRVTKMWQVMGIERPLKVGKRVFPSIKDAAAHYKIHQSMVARRLRDRWTPEQAVGLVDPPRRTPRVNAVEVAGVTYANLAEAARAFKQDPRNVRARLSRNYSLIDALKGTPRKRSSGAAKPIEYCGTIYPSRRALAEAHGVSQQLFSNRRRAGWSIPQALDQEDPPPRFRNHEGHARETKWKRTRPTASGRLEPIPDAGGYKLYVITNTVNGKQYVGETSNSLNDRLKQHFATARRRHKQPLANAIRKHGEQAFKIELLRADARSKEELLQQEYDEIARRGTIKNGYNVAVGGSLGTAKETTINGKTFPSRLHAAAHYDLPAHKLNSRIGLGWTPEEAAGLSDKEWSGKAQRVTVAGTEYPSIGAAALAHEKDPKMVYDRFSEKGWTLEQALGLEPQPDTTKYAGKPIVVLGVEYPSIASAALALGISSEPFRLRMLRDGMSPDEAFKRARKRKSPT